MTEPKITGVWSHLWKRFPAVNKCKQFWPDKITLDQDLEPNTRGDLKDSDTYKYSDAYKYSDTLLS